MALRDDFEETFQKFLPIDEDCYNASVAQLPARFGCPYGNNDNDDQAILYLLAHIYALCLKTSSAGGGSVEPAKNVTSRSVGGVSVSYGDGNDDRLYTYYGTTIYGQTFLALTERLRNQVCFV